MTDTLAIVQQIDINASERHVWHVLTQFNAYHSWNAVLHVEKAPAYLDKGALIHLQAAPESQQTRSFTAEIVLATPPFMLAWHGGEPGIFEGVHCFELKSKALTQTRLINSELFSGAMAAEILRESRSVLEAEFASFNKALKSVTELRFSRWD